MTAWTGSSVRLCFLSFYWRLIFKTLLAVFLSLQRRQGGCKEKKTRVKGSSRRRSRQREGQRDSVLWFPVRFVYSVLNTHSQTSASHSNTVTRDLSTLPQPGHLSRDHTSPEPPPDTFPVSPGEESSDERRSLPSAPPISQEEGAAERRSPPPSATPWTEAADPFSPGAVTTLLCYVLDNKHLSFTSRKWP